MSTGQDHRVRVIAVTGGKGGVGKTNVAVNLGISMAREQRVMLLDADLGLANVDVLLGLRAEKTLEQVFDGSADLSDIALEGPSGLKIIPASSGTQGMVKLAPQQHAGLVQAFSELAEQIDVLIIDTAAGISDVVASFVRASQEVLVVVCDEPSSVTDAYGLIKVMHRNYGIDAFRILANQTRTAKEGKALYQRLLAVTEHFLDVTLRYEGDIPHDESLRKAVKQQRAVVDLYPKSKVSSAFVTLAGRALQWPVPDVPSGHLEFFVEQLIKRAV